MLPPREEVAELAELGVTAFTTTREAGSYGTQADEPVGQVMGRWYALADALSQFGPRFATARQVHGTRIIMHSDGWDGWLRMDGFDGHIARTPGTALAVTIADCVPVFIAHTSGVIALLHAGWRGTAACILPLAVAAFEARGLAPAQLRVHLGPAICGRCYEVSPDVYAKLKLESVEKPTAVDLREILAAQATALGVTSISISGVCTRCHNDRFFSHRAGDAGRQLGVVVIQQ